MQQRRAVSSSVGTPLMAPSRVQLMPAAALAKRSMSSGPSPRRRATISAPRKTSPAPVVSTASTWKAGAWWRRSPSSSSAPRAPSVMQSGPSLRRRKLPERALEIRFARQGLGHVLGENRHRDGRHELLGARRDPIDVAGHPHARLARNQRRSNRGILIDVVHVQHPRRRQHLRRQLAGPQRQAVVAIPQHDALAGVLVDHDHRELIRHVADHGVAHVDADASRARRGAAGRCRRCRWRRCTWLAGPSPRRCRAPSRPDRRTTANGC